jgi:nucleotide-binding universal stress UspA family protein
VNAEQRNTVLVGVDGSERSADALALSVTLADALGVAPLAAYVHPYGDLRNVMAETQYEDAIDQLADSVHEQMRSLKMPVDKRAMTVLGDRSPARGLHRLAEERSADLVVLGSSHRSGIGRVFPGGTAERMLGGAPCAVAVAPSGYAQRRQPLRTIGLAFDGTPEGDAALHWARQLAAGSDVGVRVISVHEHLPEAMGVATYGLPIESVNQQRGERLQRELARAMQELARVDVAVDAVLVDGEPAQVLVERAADLDLLVLGSRGYGPFGRALLGSVSSAVIRDSTTPVLVAPRATGTDGG